MVKELLHAGADVNQATTNGSTPLDMAMSQSHAAEAAWHCHARRTLASTRPRKIGMFLQSTKFSTAPVRTDLYFVLKFRGDLHEMENSTTNIQRTQVTFAIGLNSCRSIEVLNTRRSIEVLNLKPGVSVLLFFASLPYCSQNQIAVSYTQHLLSDFYHDHGPPTVVNFHSGKCTLLVLETST